MTLSSRTSHWSERERSRNKRLSQVQPLTVNLDVFFKIKSVVVQQTGSSFGGLSSLQKVFPRGFIAEAQMINMSRKQLAFAQKCLLRMVWFKPKLLGSLRSDDNGNEKVCVDPLNLLNKGDLFSSS